MSKQKLSLQMGDITAIQVDAIVNAANSTLLGGGGVDGAIHRAAGPALLEACKTLGGCAVGQAKMTPGYQLPAKYIIHTVGPVWRGGRKGESKQLAACYFNSLKLALANDIHTIAFPAISCGVYGFPITQAAIIAVKETTNFLTLHEEIDQVIFMCFDQSCYEAYYTVINELAHE